jgi:hypothetical protein
MSQPEHGEFVPARLPQPPTQPPGPWSPQPHATPWPPAAWTSPWYTPMPPVRVDTTPLPRSLRAAGWLWVAASLLYLAGWIAAAVIDFPFLVAGFAADPAFADAGEEEARAAAAAMLALAVLGVMAVCAGYTALGFLLWRRQTWARVLLTVAGGIMLVMLVLDVLIGLAWRSDVDGAWRGYAILPALAAVQFGLSIAATAAMFTPAANRFFSIISGVSGGRG